MTDVLLLNLNRRLTLLIFVFWTTGPDGEGCEEGSGSVCEDSDYGCCSDGFTPAEGPNKEGCNEIDVTCAASYYGCCPDRITAAKGPAYQGCPGVLPHVPSPCANSLYGCCQDGQSRAMGPNQEGCDGPVTVCRIFSIFHSGLAVY